MPGPPLLPLLRVAFPLVVLAAGAAAAVAPERWLAQEPAPPGISLTFDQAQQKADETGHERFHDRAVAADGWFPTGAGATGGFTIEQREIGSATPLPDGTRVPVLDRAEVRLVRPLGCADARAAGIDCSLGVAGDADPAGARTATIAIAPWWSSTPASASGWLTWIDVDTNRPLAHRWPVPGFAWWWRGEAGDRLVLGLPAGAWHWGAGQVVGVAAGWDLTRSSRLDAVIFPGRAVRAALGYGHTAERWPLEAVTGRGLIASRDEVHLEASAVLGWARLAIRLGHAFNRQLFTDGPGERTGNRQRAGDANFAGLSLGWSG